MAVEQPLNISPNKELRTVQMPPVESVLMTMPVEAGCKFMSNIKIASCVS